MTIRELHRDAMSIAQAAFEAQRLGKQEEATELFKQAHYLEAQAATTVVNEPNAEPTRSVLLRSAATLAFHAHELREAERLICHALSGEPPFEIAEELRELLEDVHAERHLQLKGIKLQRDELQLSISGGSAGNGFAQGDPFFRRVKTFERLVSRTKNRLEQKDFDDGGTIRATEGKSEFLLFMGAPRRGSFAVTLHLGVPDSQLEMEGDGFDELDVPKRVIEDILRGLQFYEARDWRGLERHIPDKDYRENFVLLARQLAPDGRQFKQVGFTHVVGDKELSVMLSARTDEYLAYSEPEIIANRQVTQTTEIATVKGELRFADSKPRKKPTIEVVDDAGASVQIRVEPAMMQDIVRPLFEARVVATARRRLGVGKNGRPNPLELIDIRVDTE